MKSSESRGAAVGEEGVRGCWVVSIVTLYIRLITSIKLRQPVPEGPSACP